MAEYKKKDIEFRDDDFVLVQENVTIKDQKLETKPTTFAKDAFRRFCKNKSSVVAAVILSILILAAIFVPVISPSNIEKVSTPEAFLAPKMFNAGTGFWDGTRKKIGIVYDWKNEVPAVEGKFTKESIKAAIVKIDIDKTTTKIDTAHQCGFGGVAVVATDAAILNKNGLFFSAYTSFNAKDNYNLKVVFSNEDGVSNSKLGEYRVFLKTNDGTIIPIRDFSTDYSEINFNISEALASLGLSTVRASVQFEVKSAEDAFRYILIEKCVLSADETAVNHGDLGLISINDATEMINCGDKNDISYWSCTGRKGIHNSEIYYCSYVVDTYALIYGNADLLTYSAVELQSWIDQGWCEYDPAVGPESFKKLSENCPLDKVVSQQIKSVTKKLSSVTGEGYKYYQFGYTKMPSYILGTDASGFDIFKKAFAGLRTSLILGVLTAAFCFMFGLVWGSISGYFGGTVDLLMERFCEILSGVPWIVIMTLCILHLGNNFGTFLLALCITDWMGTASRTRTQFYRFKGREYILASRTLGSSDMRLIFKHILPNSMGTIITSSVLLIPSVIFSEASLAYLNLGLQGLQSFGVMMSDNQKYLGIYPNLVIFPAVIMALMMISFNLFGNGLRDAFNPTLKGSE